MIAEKENGLLLTAGDVDGLASASVSLMADEGLRRAMGGHGEKIVNEKFNIHVQVDKLKDLYMGLIKNYGK
jgi:glycosyltransferase involved in cell wall biosynthesis